MRDLAQYPLVNYEPSFTAGREVIEAFEHEGLTPRERARCGTQEEPRPHGDRERDTGDRVQHPLQRLSAEPRPPYSCVGFGASP